VHPGTHTLLSSPDLQDQIDALDEEVQILNIVPADPFHPFYPKSGFVLERKLPKLISLQICDVAMRKIILSPELTPNLEILILDGCLLDNEESEIQVECPKMVDCDIRNYMADDFSWFHRMLEKATHLQTFLSYQLGVSSIKLESNDLMMVKMERAFMLNSLTIWAPRLQQLFLDGPTDMKHLELLESHPVMARELPASCRFLTPVDTCLENFSIASDADETVRAFMRNPRLRQVRRGWDGSIIS
jgi:hypothetical protein